MLEAALFPKKLDSNFLSLDFCTTFYVGSGSKSGSGMYCGSGFSKGKKLRFRFHNTGYESVDAVAAA
jgi:hypothetical protein